MIAVTVEELGQMLRALPAETPLPYPVVLASWRGDYSELAIHPAGRREGAVCSAHDLAQALEAIAADGDEVEGYKGGTFPVSRWTLVHLASYGTSAPPPEAGPLIELIGRAWAAFHAPLLDAQEVERA